MTVKGKGRQGPRKLRQLATLLLYQEAEDRQEVGLGYRHTQLPAVACWFLLDMCRC